MAADDAPIYCIDAFRASELRHEPFQIQRLEALVRHFEFVSRPHRHDFYYILYIEQGQGRHIIDFEEYKICPGAAFMLTPGQVHSWELSPDVTGYVVCFEREFLSLSPRNEAVAQLPFFRSYGATSALYLDIDTSEAVQSFVEQLHHEFHQDLHYRDQVLRATLELLLFQLCRFHDRRAEQPFGSQLYEQINRYRTLIEEHFRKVKIVSEYAEMMCMTPKHLTTICRRTVGKKASTLIQERVILEAKRMLIYSDHTVQRIAYDLDFNEPSYFVRYFRKAVGTTPEKFRQEQRKGLAA